MSNNLDRVLIAITVVATLSIVPFLLRFEKHHEGWSSESSEVIAKMSASEREDLEANARRLTQHFSTEKREAIEEIHAAVADPDVAARLDAYHDWFQSLDVLQRDSIRSASGIEKKVTEIQQLLSEAEDSETGFYVDADDRWMRRFRGAEFAQQLKEDLAEALNGPTRLWVSDQEYGRILSVLIESFPEEVRRDFEDRMEKVKPSVSESELFRARTNAIGRAMGAYLKRNRRSPDVSPEAVSKVLSEIEDSETRQGLLSLAPEQQLALVDGMKMQSMNELRFLRRFSPSDKQAADYFTELTRPEQIELMALPVSFQRVRLKLTWLTNNEETPDDIRELAAGLLERIKEGPRRRGRQGREGGRRGGGGGRRSEDENRPPSPDRPKRPGQN